MEKVFLWTSESSCLRSGNCCCMWWTCSCRGWNCCCMCWTSSCLWGGGGVSLKLTLDDIFYYTVNSSAKETSVWAPDYSAKIVLILVSSCQDICFLVFWHSIQRICTVLFCAHWEYTQLCTFHEYKQQNPLEDLSHKTSLAKVHRLNHHMQVHSACSANTNKQIACLSKKVHN